MIKKTDEDQINLLLFLGTFKSLTEQMYNLKDVHQKIVKKRFNLLMTTFTSYEKSLDKDWLKDNKVIVASLNDSITDMVYMIRDRVEKKG